MKSKKQTGLSDGNITKGMVYDAVVAPIKPFFIGMPITIILLLGATILSFMVISAIERYSRLNTSAMEVIYFVTIFSVSLIAGYLAGKLVAHNFPKKASFSITILTLIVTLVFFIYAGLTVGIIMLLTALPAYIFGLSIKYLINKRVK